LRLAELGVEGRAVGAGFHCELRVQAGKERAGVNGIDRREMAITRSKVGENKA
jgi:hypothetical protein